MILGTAGHIDHGKTTLVRALTGVDTDRLPEEKRRGITIELGFAPLHLEGVGTVGVVDVPGHEGFVRTMLAGATGVDLALLVIAADEGVMPQTREHLAILRLLGVERGVVALTKCDLVDDEWRELVVEDVRALLADTPLADAPIVATSSTTGAGLDDLRAAISAAARAVPARAGDDLFRMPVDRAFTIKGTGTVVTGTVWSGRLTRDATVRVLPVDRAVRVRGIQTHGDQVQVAEPGHRTAVALAGIDVADVNRGSFLVADGAWRESNVLRAEVVLLDDAPKALRARTAVRFHIGTADIGARVVASDGVLAPGERKFARVVLDEPVVLRAGDRFVLRSASPASTIGGGIVVDPFATRRARPWEVEPHSAPALRLGLALREAGESGLDVASLPIRLGVLPRELEPLLGDDTTLRINGRVYASEVAASLESRLVSLVDDAHRARPLETGVSLQELRSRLAAPQELIDFVLARAAEQRLVETEGGTIRAAGWSPRLTDAQRVLLGEIDESVRAAAYEPPSVGELTPRFGAVVADLLRHLERQRRVVAVEPDRYYSTESVNLLIERLRTGMVKGREYSPAELRELLGFSRKFLIPFLEYCDRQGLTTRTASGRVWRV
ncbi:MAG TPA: selenocysteine-specific translation elongation factor [Gemmatimonadaceae bacterium]|jgi:selenocysteine-specific elongation factor